MGNGKNKDREIISEVRRKGRTIIDNNKRGKTKKTKGRGIDKQKKVKQKVKSEKGSYCSDCNRQLEKKGAVTRAIVGGGRRRKRRRGGRGDNRKRNGHD